MKENIEKWRNILLIEIRTVKETLEKVTKRMEEVENKLYAIERNIPNFSFATEKMKELEDEEK